MRAELGNRRLLSAALLLISLVLVGSAAQAGTNYEWTLGDSGNWVTGGNWDPTGPPNAVGAYAFIDGGRTGNVNVTLYTGGGYSPTVSGLTVDAGDSLTIPNWTGLILKPEGSNPFAITNNGTITTNGAAQGASVKADGGQLTLTGTGTLWLLPGSLESANAGTFLNETGHTIRGTGDINAAVTNKGNITASNGDLRLNQAITNQGMVGAVSGGVLDIRTSVSGGQVNPGDGSVRFTGGQIHGSTLGSGAVNVGTGGGGTNGLFYGASTSAASITVANWADLYLRAEGVTAPDLTNNGTITLQGGAQGTALYADGAIATLRGTGSVVMESNSSLTGLNGGSFVNEAGHTIQGSGSINAAVANKSGILANNGTLTVNNAITNQGAGAVEVSGGSSVLDLRSAIYGGQVNPGDGSVLLIGGTLHGLTLGTGAVNVGTGGGGTNGLFYGANTSAASITVANWTDLYLRAEGATAPDLTNNGTITLKGGAQGTTLYADSAVATLRGTGSVVMEWNSALTGLNGGSFMNEAGHTIQGSGSINAAVNNKGFILANSGTLTVNNAITGSGALQVTDNATLNLLSNPQAGNFTMANLATLAGGSYRTVSLSQGFSFSQTDENKWNSGAGFGLAMNGAGSFGNQRLEVGGHDDGVNNSGFTGNFHLANLSLSGAGTEIYLTDWIDNGNRGSDEALYVDALTVSAGATLNLDELNLYVLKDGNPYQVTTADSGQSWLGGGTIINELVPVPLPPSVWLLGSALLALGGLSRKFKR